MTRYVTPLREGGSLPAITEADDGFLYVLKFRGAGQGIKALIAECIGGEIARSLGLKVPEIVLAQLDAAFGRTEPDEEIQDLLKASVGLNIGLHYLSGSISFDPVVNRVDPLTASQIVWLDCLLTNVDRTARNTNMLIWNKELWLIDHGAALYFHHSWDNWNSRRPDPSRRSGTMSSCRRHPRSKPSMPITATGSPRTISGRSSILSRKNGCSTGLQASPRKKSVQSTPNS